MFSFIETRLFTKLVLDYLADDDYAALQEALMVDPDAGPVIPGSGASGSCAGRLRVEANAVDTGSSTTCAAPMASSGC